MDKWEENLILAVVLFALILLPSLIPWSSAVEKRPLRDSDLGPRKGKRKDA
jgi:hypothetical protein